MSVRSFWSQRCSSCGRSELTSKDILIPDLKEVFDLTDFRSWWIRAAFFGGYISYFAISGYKAKGDEVPAMFAVAEAAR